MLCKFPCFYIKLTVFLCNFGILPGICRVAPVYRLKIYYCLDLSLGKALLKLLFSADDTYGMLG